MRRFDGEVDFDLLEANQRLSQRFEWICYLNDFEIERKSQMYNEFVRLVARKSTRSLVVVVGEREGDGAQVPRPKFWRGSKRGCLAPFWISRPTTSNGRFGPLLFFEGQARVFLGLGGVSCAVYSTMHTTSVD